MKIRVVVDTNVLISAVISDGPPRRLIDGCAENEITLVISQPLMQEFVEVLNRPKLKLSKEEIQHQAQALDRTAEKIDIISDVRVVQEDPDDNKILATALDGKADYIISGDSHLLDLEEFQRIPIMRVSEFLTLHF